MILGIRTDKPEAELYLCSGGSIVLEKKWAAHRELSNTLLDSIDELILSGGIHKKELTGIVVFQGPGSFTGLRIGITVANTLAYTYKLNIVGVEGDEWLSMGCSLLSGGNSDTQVVPRYGQDAHITQPKK